MNCNTRLQVQFAEYVYIDRVYIYETWHAGAVKSVKAFTDQWVTMWTGTPQSWITTARIFSPPIQVCVCWGRGVITDNHTTEDQ